jgi:hypothetical protein
MSATNTRFSQIRIQRLELAFSLMFLMFSGLPAFAHAAQNVIAANSETRSPQAIRIVFFTPSDRAVPGGARERLTKIADATEKFFFNGMNHWGYPPVARSLFRREPDGLVEVLNVKGDMPASSGNYDLPTYAKDVIKQATRQYHVTGEGLVWWIFIYLGEPPARFEVFMGTGNPRDGGWSMANYDSTPGEIRSDFGLAEGFNGKYFLKGTIHELGHALGLPHTGPDLSLGLGNSLMGPTTAEYKARKGPNPEQVYLNESSAAMLWKHPLFSGIPMNGVHLPSVKLVDYKPVFDRTNDTVTISGKLVSDQTAHSVVLIDDLGRPGDEYWVQSHTARIGPGGVFQININKPAKVNGQYQIVFCFDNGFVTGDGDHVTLKNQGAIQKAYSFRNDDFQFGN